MELDSISSSSPVRMSSCENSCRTIDASPLQYFSEVLDNLLMGRINILLIRTMLSAMKITATAISAASSIIRNWFLCATIAFMEISAPAKATSSSSQKIGLPAATTHPYSSVLVTSGAIPFSGCSMAA